MTYNSALTIRFCQFQHLENNSVQKASIQTSSVSTQTEAVVPQVLNPVSDDTGFSKKPDYLQETKDPSTVNSALEDVSQNQNRAHENPPVACFNRLRRTRVYYNPLVPTAQSDEHSKIAIPLFQQLSLYKFPEEADLKKYDTTNRAQVKSMLQDFWLQIFKENTRFQWHYLKLLEMLGQSREAVEQQQVSND